MNRLSKAEPEEPREILFRHKALGAILLLLPFHKALFEFEIVIVTFNVYSTGIIVFFMIAMIKLLFPGRHYNFDLLDILLMLFCLIFLISTMLSTNLIRSGRLAYVSIFLPIISYFVCKAWIQTEKQFQYIFKSALLGTTLFCVLGLLEHGFVSQRKQFFEQPFISAATIAVIACILLLLLKYYKKPAGAIGLLCSVGLLVATYSRAYLIGLLISPFIYKLFRKNHVIKMFIILFPIGFILTFLIALNSESFKYMYFSKAETDTISRVTSSQHYIRALSIRAKQYRDSLNEFKDNPVLGTGIKSVRGIVTVHNFHFEWLQYGGIIGYLLAFSSFLVYFLNQQSFVETDPYMAALVTVNFIILLNSFTNGIMHGIMPYYLYIFIGIGEARRHLLSMESDQAPASPMGLKGIGRMEQAS